MVTLTDVSNNKLFLTVTQVKAGETPSNPEQPDNPGQPDNPYVPQTYQQSTTFTSWEAGGQSVKPSDMGTAVKQIDKESGMDWLTVEKENYTSGAPSVKLTVMANEGTKERAAIVTITAENDDKVLLTVKQLGRTYGVDDTHDTESDQPTYSRQK